ncbi:MAG: tetratricopeptide repeat protein, partial [Planctomycetes bacterium]|nr:tetratricopeptide repeat protein [Planctomycetota bacterium]
MPRQVARYVMLLTCVMFAACASTPERTKESGKTPEVSAEVQSGLLQGDQAYRRGDTDRALFHYVTALNLDPENTDLLYRIGMIHSENKSLDAADQAFNQILALQPDHAGALEGHGLVLLRQRKYAEAKQLLETVVQKDSGRWRAYNGLGVISDINNNHALAISYYELALQQRRDLELKWIGADLACDAGLACRDRCRSGFVLRPLAPIDEGDGDRIDLVLAGQVAIHLVFLPPPSLAVFDRPGRRLAANGGGCRRVERSG